MKVKKSNFSLGALALVVTCGYVPASLAVPTTTNADTLDYQGAHFTLAGERTENGLLRMTYTADFSEFENSGDQSYIKSIDWKWEGDEDEISSVALTAAPGGPDSWQTRTNHQIGRGISGCVETGGANAVCTEFMGGTGVSTTTQQLLTWIFEITFRDTRQKDIFLRDGLRTAYVDNLGSLASPILSCGNIGGVDCASDLIQPQPRTLEGASVPVPGVPALLLIGLAGLSLTRGGKGRERANSD